MPIGPARMPLFDHLGELRRRLTIVVVCVVIATIVMYFASPTIIDLLKAPIEPYLDGGKFVMTGALGGFAVKFGVAVKTAVVMCTPMIVWQILAFFLPALKPSERKWVVPTVVCATVLFFVGAVFCYFIIVPPGFEWLLGETKTIADPMADLENYINIEILLLIGFGVSFELPLIVFYLAVFHIVPYSSFRAAWRYIYVAMMVVSASITPDANPITLLLMYAAMLSLYEISLAVTRIVIVAREGKKGLSEGRLTAFFSDDDEDEE